ncbi:hypothetical protein [Thauera sp. SDU_THAU2]|uniref:hypothetical protein n=1 Tax=Thauera sp. SDU_THAU2 TaxID=3136633 RepID=UPI00311D890D
MNRFTRMATLATLASAAAFPCAAQSNVTIYGLLDVNLGYERSGDLRHKGWTTAN